MSFQYLKLIQRKLISKVNRRALSEGFSLINIKYKSYIPGKNLVLISRKLNFIFALLEGCFPLSKSTQQYLKQFKFQ